jgi:hypothetical protein
MIGWLADWKQKEKEKRGDSWDCYSRLVDRRINPESGWEWDSALTVS